MSARATPGPWASGPAPLSNAYWITRDSTAGKYVAGVEREADALLIAAAPDLLRELKAAHIIIEQARKALLAAHADRHFTIRATERRAAIAKATGGTP